MSASSTNAVNEKIDDRTAPYRAVSGLAVLALVLGILSAAAVVGPILWFIPLLAVIMALVAMRRIHVSQDLAGWNVAFLGLLLALLFGIAAPARTVSRQYWLSSRAEEFSDQFLKYLQQNNPHVAHQLKERAGVRKPLTDTLSDAYKQDPVSQKNLDQFISEEPAKTLLQQGTKAKIDRMATEFLGIDSRQNEIFSIRYRIMLDGSQKELETVTIVKRSVDQTTGRETWQIEKASIEK